MPDLSHEASAEYWYGFPDPSIYRVLTFLESVEPWTLDGQAELEAVLVELGRELDDISNVNMSTLGHEDRFIQLVANLKSSRGLRLLQAIDQVHPGSASKVLVRAEETTISSHDNAGFFLKRNITFERLRLLSRVFSDMRLKLVNKALEGDE